ncbi:MAG TPA: exosortase/archaeosortase family protein [Caldilineaceae bacterium]|nr:exosortase/archaeosortase family protein [Caldilineaceae bacterium]
MMIHPHRHSWLLTVFIIILFFLITWPIWQWLWGEWLGNDYYSHGLLIPFVAVFLAVRRWQLHTTQTAQPVLPTTHEQLFVWLRGLWLLISTIAYLCLLYYKAYYLAGFAMIGMIGGIVWVLGRQALLGLWLFPIGYLLLMVPIPLIERITYPLAIFAGLCGGGLVRLFGMDLTIVGNAVTLPNAELVIGAQCSGINSLMALTALMVLAAYLVEGPRWARLSLIIAAVPLAILGNILRIASLIFVARNYGADAAFTFYHDYSGFLFFVSILLLMIPMTRLLQIKTLRLDVI